VNSFYLQESKAMSNLLQQWPHHWFGFFGATIVNTPYLPTVEEVTDQRWNPDDKALIVDYLRTAPTYISAVTHEIYKCPFCAQVIDQDDSRYQSDNEWLWPCGLYHFVEKHYVVLPDRLIAHIRRQSHIPPEKITVGYDHFAWPSKSSGDLQKYRLSGTEKIDNSDSSL
jgi:hypothetical protein